MRLLNFYLEFNLCHCFQVRTDHQFRFRRFLNLFYGIVRMKFGQQDSVFCNFHHTHFGDDHIDHADPRYREACMLSESYEHPFAYAA